MPYRRTIGDLVTLCQQRVGRQNDGSLDDATWKRMFSTAYGQLWQEVVNAAGRYFETTYNITTDGSVSYTEPSAHYLLMGVDRLIDNTATGRRRPLRQLEVQERNVYAGQTGEAIGYSLVDDQLFLYPTPPAGQMYQWLYVPSAPKYGDTDGLGNQLWVDDATQIDVVDGNGEAFCIWDVAVQLLASEEADVFTAMRERDAARERLRLGAIIRNLPTFHRPVHEDGVSRDPAEYPDRGGWWSSY